MNIIIVGGGQTGSYLASLLASNGHTVRVIEHREKVFAKLQKELNPELLIYGSGTNPEVLERAGVSSANVVAAVTGEDEVNLVVSMLAKMEYDVPRVVARVNNPHNKWLFTPKMGVDVGINQADLMAHFVLEEMNLKEMFTLLKLGRGDHSIVQMELQETSKAVDSRLKDLDIPRQAILIAVIRGGKIRIPKGDTLFEKGDEVLAFTDDAGREALKGIFG